MTNLETLAGWMLWERYIAVGIALFTLLFVAVWICAATFVKWFEARWRGPWWVGKIQVLYNSRTKQLYHLSGSLFVDKTFRDSRDAWYWVCDLRMKYATTD